MLDALKAIGMFWMMPFYGIYYAISAVFLPAAWIGVQHTWISPVLVFLSWKGFGWAFGGYGKQNPGSIWASRRIYVMIPLALAFSAWISILLAMPDSYAEGGDMYRDPGEIVDVEQKTKDQKRADAGSNMICIGLPAAWAAIRYRQTNPKTYSYLSRTISCSQARTSSGVLAIGTATSPQIHIERPPTIT